MKFDTIALLKSTAGTTDNFANVLGYYAAGDGGGGDFYWDPTSTDPDNSGTIFQVTGTTTGRWKRLYSGSVFFKWFGAKADGVTDDSGYIQNLINAFSGGDFEFDLNLLIESDPNAKYGIANTIFIPCNVSIDFNQATIIPLAGGTFLNNFMFYLNSDDTKHVVAHFSDNRTTFIRNVFINNRVNNVAAMNIFFSLSKHSIENMRVEGVQTFYSKTNSADDTNYGYTDQITISRIFANFSQDIDTQNFINIGWFGDNLKIENVELLGATISVKYCQGGVLDRLLNTNLIINACFGLTISNCHLEKSNTKIFIQNSTVKLSNITHQYQGGIPLTITNDSSSYGSLANKSCIIENYNVLYYEGRTTLPLSYSTDVFDAFINGNVIINNFFRTTNYGTATYVTATATRITRDGTASFDDYNYCAANSISSTIVNGKVTSTNQSINSGIPSTLYIGNSGRPFSEASATYYYKAVVMLGDTRCMLATSTSIAQLSIAVTGTVKSPSINNPALRSGNSYTLRLYRGTTSGSYDYYVDIPFTAFDTIIDYGFYTNTGHYWKLRATPGAIDTFNTATSASTFVQNADSTKVVKLAAAPTVGTWKVGDKIEKLAPDATNIGWICTSISPLTFLAY